ncbi:MAG: hypothetical protein JXD23_10125 [Spirochaetales bacterium]|nr:hypothetical protein [Spirochaetales bacterium]
MAHNAAYTISLEFKSIRLPPVTDILVLGKKYPHGKNGVLQAFKYIAPDEFEAIDADGSHENVETVFVDKRILKRMPKEKIIAVLEQYVFPYVMPDEAVKVDFRLTMKYDNIKGAV